MVLSRNLIEISSWRSNPLACQSEHLDLIRNLPDIPVLPESLLLMELQVREPSVDLAKVSQIVLSDLGAVLQIMRLARCECASSDWLPQRIEDCIAGLDLQMCLEVMSRRTVARSKRSTVAGVWAHAREIAALCGFLAEQAAASTSPQDAYLVGLFHELGNLPAVLDWDVALTRSRNQSLAGLNLAGEWPLPLCVFEYFSDHLSLKSPSKWIELVEQAHRLADSLTANYPTGSHHLLEMHLLN